MNTSKPPTAPNHTKKKRIWADGVFDLPHYGHFNALRQSKLAGQELYVGVHSDEDVLRHKGPTVLTLEERCVMIDQCKWVDKVIPGAPYVTTLETMDENECDVCTHGEDITLDENGIDTYQAIKDANRMHTIKRSEGVSTTDLVGRMLLATRGHHTPIPEVDETIDQFQSQDGAGHHKSPYTKVGRFVPTSMRIVQFSEGREPGPNDKVVYADGAFDLFHPGHATFLKKAREMGDFLLVGIHDDDTVNQYKGVNHPIMNMYERVLSVLACKYVDEVVIGSPLILTEDFLKSLRIDHVACGASGEPWAGSFVEEAYDPYGMPKQMGIMREVNHDYTSMTTTTLLERIMHNRLKYEQRNRSKEDKELRYLDKLLEEES